MKNWKTEITKLACFLEKNKIEGLENIYHLWERSAKMKEYLRNTHNNTINNTNNKVICITHSSFVKVSTSLILPTLGKVDYFPKDCYFPNNCEAISMII